jgi:hypothetical protein
MHIVFKQLQWKIARVPAAPATCAMLLLSVALMPGCSVYMEATRPTPHNLTQFQPGQARDTVLERLGAPVNTVSETDGASCDFYQLYTHGYGAGGKVPIALVEAAADVFSLGLARSSPPRSKVPLRINGIP